MAESANNLRNVLDDWQEWARKQLVEDKLRTNEFRLPPKQALALIGVRRSGKTHLALATAEKAVGHRYLYLNFEDPYFLRHSDFSILDEAVALFTEHRGFYPEIVVLDEIQEIRGWEKWVRKHVELGKTKLILTGSSAKMLSKELATSIAGRVIVKTVWPLSFEEFLVFRDAKVKRREEYLALLKEYIEWGAFPEVALTNDEDLKSDILHQYFSDIVLKDIISRNPIRNKKHLDQVINHYFINLSSLHSYSALKKAYQLGGDVPSQYTSALSDAFLVFEVGRFHKNLKVQARDPKKIYVIDTGMRNLNCRADNEDVGKKLENIVYIHLRRMGFETLYFKGTRECDFVVLDRKKAVAAVQVTASNLEEPSLYDREVGGLLECLRSLRLPEGILITRDREQVITEDGHKIRMIPAYRWLLKAPDSV